MPNDNQNSKINLSRRKILTATGAIGASGLATGLGSQAFFADREQFGNNQLVAGELDMKVGWEEHYSDWSEDEAEHAHMEDGELVVDDREGYMNATLQEQFPDKQTKKELNEGTADPCDVLVDVPDDRSRPLIELTDVKPGDSGEVTFSFALCDNPGWVWMNGSLIENAENGLTEPESKDEDEQEGVVELLDELQITIWRDDGDNVIEDPETIVTDREFEPNPISSAVTVSGDDRIIFQGSLRNVLEALNTGDGILIDGLPGENEDDFDCFTDSPTIHNIGFLWELPTDHGNEIQTDSVTFDLGFYTEQCRHNMLGTQDDVEEIPDDEIPDDPEWCTYVIKSTNGSCPFEAWETVCVLCPDSKCPSSAGYIVKGKNCAGAWKLVGRNCGGCTKKSIKGIGGKYKFA